MLAIRARYGMIKILLRLVQAVSIGFLIVHIVVNLFHDRGFIFPLFKIYDVYPDSPEKDFIALKPYLDHVPWAGFWTDFTPSNPDVHLSFIKNFYQAQYALAPTLLDIDRPFTHLYVVVLYKNKDHFLTLMKEQKARIVVQLRRNIVLIQRPI